MYLENGEDRRNKNVVLEFITTTQEEDQNLDDSDIGFFCYQHVKDPLKIFIASINKITDFVSLKEDQVCLKNYKRKIPKIPTF